MFGHATVTSETESVLSALNLRFQNIPASITKLVGRAQQEKAACALLLRPEVRLLTLTGTGGIGKTRLALQISSDLLESFANGVCFVPLASISDFELVIPTIAQTLGVRDREGFPIYERLKAFLRDIHLLLVLDNFEQVLPTAPLLTDLLSACPHIKIIVTSRTVLRLQGEYEFPVQLLTVPNLEALPPPEALSQYTSIALFVRRAQAYKHDFQVTANNAPVIAEICVRLDGLPLALELAAARTRLLSLDVLLTRLQEHQLTILIGRNQDTPERQQTLRNTVTWSYNLLTGMEQALLRRLSIFAGGCTLEAAEAVCNATGDLSVTVLDGVTSLLDKSLLQRIEVEGYEPRISLLQVIREYGLEALATSGEMERCQSAHADYYLRLSRQAEPALFGPTQAQWREQLERDHANLRSALQYLLQRGDVETTLRLMTALRQYWMLSGYVSEDRRLLEQALSTSYQGNTPSSDSIRAKALAVAGRLVYWQNEPEQAARLFAESERLSRQIGDKGSIAGALHYLGHIAHNQGEIQAAAAIQAESLRLYREVGDQEGTAETLIMLGARALYHGEYDRACELCEEGLGLFRKFGNFWCMAVSLHYLGWTVYSQGDFKRARQLSQESVTIFAALGKPLFSVDAQIVLAYALTSLGEEANAHALLEETLALSKERENMDDIGRTLCALGHLALRHGDLTQARKLFEESIIMLKGRWPVPRIKWVVASCLEGLGEITLPQGQPAWTIRLFAAAEAMRSTHGYYTPLGLEQPLYEQTLAKAYSQLEEATIASLWAQGKDMSPEQALAAYEKDTSNTELSTSTPTLTPSPILTHPAGLTRRELEVLRQLAQGKTTNRIAETLVISPSTVDTHIQSIYHKLGVSSRSAATRLAIEHRLA
jgi:predicted ATPase/DNA-binding CsgD family transcriptional regulator